MTSSSRRRPGRRWRFWRSERLPAHTSATGSDPGWLPSLTDRGGGRAAVKRVPPGAGRLGNALGVCLTRRSQVAAAAPIRTLMAGRVTAAAAAAAAAATATATATAHVGCLGKQWAPCVNNTASRLYRVLCHASSQRPTGWRSGVGGRGCSARYSPPLPPAASPPPGASASAATGVGCR
eukprot:SAG25_NODE_536_length_7104_cov_4.295789_7_plen_179_part_00